MIDLPQPTTLDPDLQKIMDIQFTKQELIVIFNSIVQQSYRLGAAKVIIPILDRIEPLVAAAHSSDFDQKAA